LDLRINTRIQSAAQRAAASKISEGRGEKIRTKPLPLTSAAKLETQNGITKSRTVGQKPSLTLGWFEVVAVVLM
jgi:hypothetical protein